MSPTLVMVVLSLALTLVASGAGAEPVAVKHPEGSVYGILALRAAAGGDALAQGELLQTPQGENVQSQLVFRFKDGSLYDETLTFSQKKVFRLLSYKIVQRGPAFGSAASEVSFDRSSGRYRAKSGDDTADGAIDLPEDLHNGMTGTLLRNLPPGSSATGHVYAFTPKARLMKSTLRAEGEEKYYVGDVARTATRYLVKLDLSGIIGVVASVLGKDPPDLRFWISGGPAPAFMKFEGAMYVKGPRWRIELATPRWPNER